MRTRKEKEEVTATWKQHRWNVSLSLFFLVRSFEGESSFLPRKNVRVKDGRGARTKSADLRPIVDVASNWVIRWSKRAHASTNVSL